MYMYMVHVHVHIMWQCTDDFAYYIMDTFTSSTEYYNSKRSEVPTRSPVECIWLHFNSKISLSSIRLMPALLFPHALLSSFPTLRQTDKYYRITSGPISDSTIRTNFMTQENLVFLCGRIYCSITDSNNYLR